MVSVDAYVWVTEPVTPIVSHNKDGEGELMKKKKNASSGKKKCSIVRKNTSTGKTESGAGPSSITVGRGKCTGPSGDGRGKVMW